MPSRVPKPAPTARSGATAVLVLEDGTQYWGRGVGAAGEAIGEICFNTSITGYQEILTDPSYAGQIITFTFPHIGNVGANSEDMEAARPAARGLVLRADITEPANWRAHEHLDSWLKAQNLVGIAGIDTRRLTRQIRDLGAARGTILHLPDAKPGRGGRKAFEVTRLQAMATDWPGLEGMDLAREVTCSTPYAWNEAGWEIGTGYNTATDTSRHVVAVDFGAKHNILRCLAAAGCRVTVMPATSSADDILAQNPDGIFLSNGPGDPAATADYAVPMLGRLLASNKPMFGICLGHQLLALALGAGTKKMHHGHRGGNHPVKDLATGRVEITSQNHGFVVERDSLPPGVIETHSSLFDGTLEGIKVEGRPVFSVQYHPEASPGPQDSHFLFNQFIDMIDTHA